MEVISLKLEVLYVIYFLRITMLVGALGGQWFVIFLLLLHFLEVCLKSLSYLLRVLSNIQLD